MHSESITNSLEDVHHRFLVTPVFKASEDIAVICKRFCVLTLMKERRLGGSHASIPKTYETCVAKTNDLLFNSHANTIFRYLRYMIFY